MNDDDLFPIEPQTSEPEYDWKDVSDGCVRHKRHLDRVRHTSCGVIETDATGLVVRVAGHLGRPCKRDERDPSRFVEWEPNAPAPTREQVLEQPGFVDCADHPYPAQAAEAARAEDAAAEAAEAAPSGDPEPHVPQPDDPKPDGPEAERSVDEVLARAASDPEPEAAQVGEATGEPREGVEVALGEGETVLGDPEAERLAAETTVVGPEGQHGGEPTPADGEAANGPENAAGDAAEGCESSGAPE